MNLWEQIKWCHSPTSFLHCENPPEVWARRRCVNLPYRYPVLSPVFLPLVHIQGSQTWGLRSVNLWFLPDLGNLQLLFHGVFYLPYFLFLPPGTPILHVRFSDILPQLSEALFMSVCMYFQFFSLLQIGYFVLVSPKVLWLFPLSFLFSYGAHPVKFLFCIFFQLPNFHFVFLCSFFFPPKISYSLIFRAHVPFTSLNRVVIAL